MEAERCILLHGLLVSGGAPRRWAARWAELLEQVRSTLDGVATVADVAAAVESPVAAPKTAGMAAIILTWCWQAHADPGAALDAARAILDGGADPALEALTLLEPETDVLT